MVLEKRHQTTIAISRKNHLELSELCKKGQSFDDVLTQVLKKIKESNEKKDGQSKSGIGSSDTLAAEPSIIQTANWSESDYEYKLRKQ